ncbi:MAG: T9SS C-terminal target domain-containing protein [Ignavibacteriae bacterium]|nr:MAG: T9SS C-terminal target domain-containing protein [Ignavibacteriota bacterium]
MKKSLILLLILLCSGSAYSQVTPVYGVTIDGVNPISDIKTSLSSLPKKLTTRIVFDEWVPATDYTNAVNQLSPVSFIMGEILDSYYMKDYSVAQYTARVNEYLSVLGSKVDIWEVGNEINGEWLGSNTVEKMTAAYNIINNAGKNTALTLYYNKNCWANSNNEMFKWTNNNVPSYMKTGLDYVWISYYEDDCNNYQPNWQVVFDSLHKIFPNSKIGIGECGTNNANQKAAYMNRYYKMNITTPLYVGGYFWWYFRQDCVPNTKPLWTTFKNILNTLTAVGNNTSVTPSEYKLNQNFPNPFNPSTIISYSIPKAGMVKLIVYDIQGKQAAILANEYRQPGEYTAEFNASSLASGIYIYKIEAGTFTDVKKMILVK